MITVGNSPITFFGKSQKRMAKIKDSVDNIHPLQGNPSPRFLERVLLLAFLFSGASSLSLEVAWSKELTYILGVDMYATTTVVTAFMGGLGLGALLATYILRRFRASLKIYGLLQVAIGCFGMISIPLFRATRPLFSLLYHQLEYSSGWFLLARFLIVLGFMLIPVTLMGMTLPVVVGACSENMKGCYAYLAGKLYGVNTVGAVLGTLAAGFLLIPSLGILKTCLIVGAVDLLIGCVILGYHQFGNMPNASISPLPPKGTAIQPGFTQNISLLQTFSWPAVVFLLSGISALIYEIVWFRLLARIIGPSVHAFSMMLATYLLGIGLGSLIGARAIRNITHHRSVVSVILGAIGAAPLITLFYINKLPVWYGLLFVRFSTAEFTIWNLVLQALIASSLILPATLLMGAFFPAVTLAFTREQGWSDDRVKETAVGYLYFYNTIGGVIGCLAAGFWLMPAAGIKMTILLASGLNIVLALAVYLFGVKTARWKKILTGLSIAAVCCATAIVSPEMDQTMLNAGLYSEMVNKEYFTNKLAPQNRKLGNLLYFHEGINNSVAVLANKFNDGNLTLHFSGCWEASTEIHGRMHLKFLGHLPMLFARKTETIGVIGFGAGITTGAVLLYPDVQRVNVFELESSVIQANRYFTFINHQPLADPRTHIFMVDGRSQITYGTQQYDVITSDPIHPFVAGSANLYTLDFYRIMSGRLNPGGIFCQWIPLVGITPESYNIILNSMHQAFPHLAVFSFCGESVIIASMDPLRADWENLEKRFYSPEVYADLTSLDVLTPFNLVSFFMGAESQINQYLSGVTQVSTDDNVWLEHRIPMDSVDLRWGNLFHMLKEKLPVDDYRMIEQVFPGMPLRDLPGNLAALKKEGNNDYKLAQIAYKKSDFEAMEKYLRGTLSDFNSSFIYPAGIQLMDLLQTMDRDDEILSVAGFLQKNFPVYPEAYIAEARVWEKKGKPDRSIETLDRGWMFAPENPNLIKWRRHFGVSG